MQYEKSRSGPYVTYQLRSELSGPIAEELVKDLKSEFDADGAIEGAVLDLQSFGLSHKAFKAISPVGLELRKKNKQIYVLSPDMKIHTMIKSEGMDKLVRPISKMSDIKSPEQGASSGGKIDVAFINPFIEGTIHVLKVQCQTEVTPEKPQLKQKGAEMYSQTDIAGLIGITSRSFMGNIAICFPEKIFLHLMSKMLGEELTQITDELTDGAGELINMIFGHAKTILNDKGHTIEKALPSVVRGPNLKIDHSSTHDSFILPFKLGDSGFFMEIGTEKNKPAR
jgi:chemotaxis protein CheX